MFDTVSSADSDQPHIRYTAGGYYEIKMPGSDWDKLIFYKGSVPDDPADFNYFQPASVAQNLGYLLTDQARKQGYTYSELAAWGSDAGGRWGWVAFGSPTAPQNVSTTGHADFAGFAIGSTDIMTSDAFYGGYVPIGVGGDVQLSFDFAAGSLTGSMSLSLPDGMQPVPLGTYAFKDTVFSVGNPTYSGKFDTNVDGDNFFLGRFTGPNAEETIGAWALPFLFTTGGETLQPDNKVHQAFGAWIAKRGN
jgi:hypothetical protein